MKIRNMVAEVQGCTNDLKDRMSEKGHPEHRRSLPSTCMEVLMQRRHGCLGAAMASRHTVHPEHKKEIKHSTCFISFL